MADAPAAPVVAPSIVNALEPGAVVAPEATPASPAPVETPPVPEPPKVPAPAADAPPAAFAADKLTLPEGMKADDATLKSYTTLMADDKISPQERGQKLLDLYADVTKQGREAATTAWNNVNKEWSDKTLADPEIGGAKFATTKATIAKAIDSLGPNLAAEVRQALDVTGAGNHPAIVKALHALSVRSVEPGHVAGTPPGTSAKPTVKEAFYPNSPDMK